MSDSTNYGWVRLHRKFLKSDMWLSEPFTKGQAWIDLFANANHKEGTFWVRGNPIKVGRGQIAWSKLTMSDRWGWSEGKVDRFIEYLKTEGQIEVQTSTKTTLITIRNYELYQADSRTDGERTASRQGTNKNDKNEKNTSEAPLRVESVHSKENTDTDRPSKSAAKYPHAQEVFSWFPNPQKSWMALKNVQEREYAEYLYERGEKAVRGILAFVEKHKNDDFFPKITKPSDLEKKWEDVKAFRV